MLVTEPPDMLDFLGRFAATNQTELSLFFPAVTIVAAFPGACFPVNDRFERVF